MVNLLPIKLTHFVAGAAKTDFDSSPSAKIAQTTYQEPIVPFTVPTMQFKPASPAYEVKLYNANENAAHLGIEYSVNKNVMLGVNTVVTRDQDFVYSGVMGRLNW